MSTWLVSSPGDDSERGHHSDQESWAIEAVCRRLGYTGLKLDHEKGVRSFMKVWDVFESLTTGSGEFGCQ